MINLLRKNLILNYKNVGLGLIAALFFGAISIDGHKYYTVALMMCPSLLFTFVVGKMCYTEDSIASQQFLLALPISKKDIVFEKNIWSYVCILIGMGIANGCSLLADIILSRNFYYNIQSCLVISALLIVYNTIYIALNYKFDYSKTQFTPYILLVFMFAFFKFGEEIINVVNTTSVIWVLLLCLVTIVINLLVLRKIAKVYMLG